MILQDEMDERKAQLKQARLRVDEVTQRRWKVFLEAFSIVPENVTVEYTEFDNANYIESGVPIATNIVTERMSLDDMQRMMEDGCDRLELTDKERSVVLRHANIAFAFIAKNKRLFFALTGKDPEKEIEKIKGWDEQNGWHGSSALWCDTMGDFEPDNSCAVTLVDPDIFSGIAYVLHGVPE